MFNRTHAQASPSVSLEKGIVRLRPVRVNGSFRSGGQPGSIFPTESERRAAAILASVAFATLLAVCLMLYLLSRSSRWDLSPLSLSTHSKLRPHPVHYDPFLMPLPTPRVLAWNPDTPAPKLQDPSERYLSYLPHSGFHNQRIALENALVLSRILNRTLLVPPVFLGDPPLRYRPSISLRIDIALSSKVGLEHCARLLEATYIPEECTDFWTHAHVPWDWFVDLPSLTRQHGIRTLMRWDLTDVFLTRLHLAPTDIYFLTDTDPYEFRFFDSLTDDKPLGTRYKSRVDLPALASLTNEYRFLQFGTLFGTTRVRLAEPENITLRGAIRRGMVFSNPDLLAIADGVRDSSKLGGDRRYAAVHLRLGDGVFADGQARVHNVRLVWWRLMRELGMSDEDALKIESNLWSERGVRTRPPEKVRDFAALQTAHSLPPLDTFHECQGSAATHPLLCMPLYIATDKPNHHVLSIFKRTFPRVYFLSNFTTLVARLDMLSASSVHESAASVPDPDVPHCYREDNIPLAPFLPPFLDAMIASKARVVVGTPGSTFSRFVEDVLWRAYHGYEIVQRG